MSGLAARVAGITGTAEERIERLAGGDLSEVLLLRRPDGRCTVAKASHMVAAEAAMLRTIAGTGVPAPAVEGEHDGILLLEHIDNDGVFSPNAWRDIGERLRLLHARTGAAYGWPVDYALGTVGLDNRSASDWPSFWGGQRLISTASVLDRPWRERVDTIAGRLGDLLPHDPPAALLHGDLWNGNILVADGRLAALIDPACYFGDAEVDLAMLSLFDTPPEPFEESYGELQPGWQERRRIYQLFPVLVHLRLFGQSYAALADRLLESLGA